MGYSDIIRETNRARSSLTEICVVCNKKIGFFSSPYPVEIGGSTKDIHYQCLDKYSNAREKYSGPSDKELERRKAERESKIAPHTPNEVTEVNHGGSKGSEPSIILTLSALGWCLFTMMGFAGIFFISQDGGGIIGFSVIIAGFFQLSIFLGFSAIIDQLYKINVNTSKPDKSDS